MEQTIPQTSAVGFLETGVNKPATHSWYDKEAGWLKQLKLVRAGDIESNPGPTSQVSTCSKCNKTIATGTTPLTCNICHKMAHKTCSGLSRYHYEKVAKGERKWTCCDGNSNGNSVKQQGDKTSGSGPNVNNCQICQKTVRQGYRTLQCKNCKISIHQRCGGVTRDAWESRLRNAWLCVNCDEEEDHARQNVEIKEEIKGNKKKIMQWNCDGIMTKITELRKMLQTNNIDICCIQETKLNNSQPTPKIVGYETVRCDRNDTNTGAIGGGMMCIIKKNIKYQVIQQTTNNNTELQHIKFHLGQEETIDVVNLYIPPMKRVADDGFEPWNLPESNRMIYTGDFNAHSPIWQQGAMTDHRGEKIEDWITTNGYCVLNDENKMTRTDRRGNRGTSPDITITTQEMGARTKWDILTTANSDHLPIIITIEDPGKANKREGRSYKWKLNDMDWQMFEILVEKEIPDNYDEEEKISENLSKFNKAIINTMKTCTRKVKVGGKQATIWWSDKVQAAVTTRDDLAKEGKRNTWEWEEACRKVTEIIKEEKTRTWKAFVESIDATTDTNKVWEIIRMLKGTSNDTTTSEAIEHQGKLLTTDMQKANGFITQYANVSKEKMDKNERKMKINASKKMNEYQTSDQDKVYENDFIINELEEAIKAMDGSKAGGQDDIPPEALKHLSNKGNQYLLKIINQSWRTHSIPQVWKNATIIPIPKPGKPTSQLISFRPISLTSAAGKICERMVERRLRHWLESNNKLTEDQAGFRKMRSTEDQLLRLSQKISDGMHNKPCNKTALLLIDFEKAFDSVWRSGLKFKMAKMGIPKNYIYWVESWLSNRAAKVNYNGTYSKTRYLTKGVPQGAVISPLLFDIFINDIGEELKNAELSLFADDAGTWTQNQDIKTAVKDLQAAGNVIVKWSKDWRLKMNESKCEMVIFSTDHKDRNNTHQIELNGNVIIQTKKAKFLGLTYNSNLSFEDHMKEVIMKSKRNSNLIYALKGTDWGWKMEEARKIYITCIRPIIEYGAPAWMSWLSKTNLHKMESNQLHFARLMTSLPKSCPTEMVLKEANLMSLEYRGRVSAHIALEKSMRLRTSHPRRKLAEESHNIRLKRTSTWRENAKKGVEPMIHQNEREEFALNTLEPWTRPNIKINNSLYPGNKKKDMLENKETIGIEMDKLEQRNITIYCDGSAEEGIKNGGAGVVITSGNWRNPFVIDTIKKKAGKYCTSFDAELLALHEAVKWAQSNINNWNNARIITDSKSLLDALINTGSKEDLKLPRMIDITRILSQITINKEIELQWVPSHTNIPGNDMADNAANEARNIDEIATTSSYAATTSAIRRQTVKPITMHDRARRTYVANINYKVEQQMNQRDRTILCRFRTGHCPKLKSIRARYGLVDSGICEDCGDEDETNEHVLSCPSHTLHRISIFGATATTSIPTSCMTTNPQLILQYLKLSKPAWFA